jgi:hypothetical protein
MKNTILKLSLLIMTIAFLSCSTDDNVNVIGSGNIIQQDRSVNSFNKVESPSSINVNIVFANTQGISITADDNVINKVTTNVSGNTLTVDLVSGNYNNITVTVTISSPDIEMTSNSGSGNIMVSGFTGLDNMSINNSGSGNTIASGTVQNSTLLNSGSGTVKSFNLISENCAITNSGSGNSEVFCNTTLSGTNSGSGNVLYKGAPTITITNSGSGSVLDSN